MIVRRSFLIGIGASLATPAIVRAESLMRVVVPQPEVIAIINQDQILYDMRLIRELDAQLSDLICYGMSITGPDGRRVDPMEVAPLGSTIRAVHPSDGLFVHIPGFRPARRSRLPRIERA